MSKRKRQTAEGAKPIGRSNDSKRIKKDQSQYLRQSEATSSPTKAVPTTQLGASHVGADEASVEIIPTSSHSALHGSTDPQYKAEPHKTQTVSKKDDIRIKRHKEKKKKKKKKRRTKQIDQSMDVGSRSKEAAHLRIALSLDSSGVTGSQAGKDTDAAWTLSTAIGGSLQDTAPLFSIDERYFFLAYEHHVQVIALATGLEIRTLGIKEKSPLTGFTLSNDSSNNTSWLYVSLLSGVIEKWDWLNGKRAQKWRTGSTTTALVTSTSCSTDTLYTLDSVRKNHYAITAHRLRAGEQTSVQTLYKSQAPISFLHVLNDGKYVVATSGKRLILGMTNNQPNSELRNLQYVWREIEIAEWITSLDAQILGDSEASAQDGSSSENMADSVSIATLDVVVGGLLGSIYVYRDVLKSLLQIERHRQGRISPQRLHWHRNGLGAVRWSRDGNYVISGGSETVLVLWQMDTLQKQVLPHLQAPIESIVISPSGTSYGIRLANNSALVLSTAELEPIVNIVGIPLNLRKLLPDSTPKVPTVATREEGKRHAPIKYPSVMSRSSDNLLIVVPTTSHSRSGFPASGSPISLQTIDASTGRPLCAQPLTRTKVTDKNLGPEYNLTKEPTVTHIQTSTDGKWLLSIDEWLPPNSDMENMYGLRHGTEQETRLEVYMKFWSWNADLQSWELACRIDGPHKEEINNTSKNVRVLDAVVDTASIGFITVGIDQQVKFWRPYIRMRDGLQVRNKDGIPSIVWASNLTANLMVPGLARFSSSDTNYNARLAISSDGSTLVVGHQSRLAAVIELIDTTDGGSRFILPNLAIGQLAGLGLIDRFLIVMSENLIVWDLVNNHQVFAYNINPEDNHTPPQAAISFLSIDQHHRLFAITVPTTKPSEAGTNIAVFDPSNPHPLFESTVSDDLVAISALRNRPGFAMVTSSGEIRTIKLERKTSVPPPLSSLHISKPPETAGLQTSLPVGNPKPSPQWKDLTPAEAFKGSALSFDDAPPLVRPYQLAEAFGFGPSHALPPVSKLFASVANLFAGRQGDVV
ncbi:hypothetical protein MMC25_003267 [Agyrium rufum]|nr:hypothetical protein [Agyrium rufum]